MNTRLLLFFCLIACLPPGLQSQTLRQTDSSANAGKVDWGKRQVTFDTVYLGQPVFADFTIRNTSSETLDLIEVRPGCHCISADWPRTSVAPGDSTVVRVTFDAAKPGAFYQITTIKTNFDPNAPIPLVISGKVIPVDTPKNDD